jgi:hypothetical protein
MLVRHVARKIRFTVWYTAEMTVPYINIRYAAEMTKTIYDMRPKNQNDRTAYFNIWPHFWHKKNHHTRYTAEKKSLPYQYTASPLSSMGLLHNWVPKYILVTNCQLSIKIGIMFFSTYTLLIYYFF